MTYAVTCPCGERLVIAFLNKCGLPGVLAVLALKDVHAVFGVLTALAFGNVHTFGNVRANSSILTLLDLGIFALLAIMWCNVVIVAFCKLQHVNFDCYVGVELVLPLHLLFYRCRSLRCDIERIVASSMLSLWCRDQSNRWRFLPLQSSMW
jgi:hypothetical protein